MAPLSIKAAKDTMDIGMTNLKKACQRLERNLPPLPPEDNVPLPPSDRPRDRASSITACAACLQELEALDVGDRDSHVCTHAGQGDQRDEDARSETGQRREREAPQVRTRNKQPKLRVVKEYMGNLDSCLDTYTEAVARYCTVLTDEDQKETYEDHMLDWVIIVKS